MKITDGIKRGLYVLEVYRVADTELILLIAHLIRLPGSIPGVG